MKRLGRGLIQNENKVFSNRAGVLKKVGTNKYFIDNNQKRVI